mmetsp:Transcript_18693/g.28149  ORF Transcript_18693/g.28149 Transcript_18693/m.28149 type:complete len:232 (+) Transcript_18693:229-924(+)
MVDIGGDIAAVVDTKNATASNLPVTPPKKSLPRLNAFVGCQFLKEGDQMVFYLYEEKILTGEVFLRERGATIKLEIQHLTELVDNNQARLKKILGAVEKHCRNLVVDEIVEDNFFTTSVTIFVQIAHELQREAGSPSSNITASNPYGDQNLFVMPCKSAQDCDRLVLMSTFREEFDREVRWIGRGRPTGSVHMSKHILGKAHGVEKKRKREREAGGGGEKQSDGGGNCCVR